MITKIDEYLMYLNYKNCIIIENKLNEGLIKTYTPDFVYKYLKKELRNYDVNIFIDKDINFPIKNSFKLDEYKFPMQIEINNRLELIDLLNIQKNINLCGYFISCLFFDDMKINTIDEYGERINEIEYDTINILIEAKYDVSISVSELEMVDKYIYHISDIKHRDKILKNGLIAKSKSKLSYHLDRIYFETDKNNIFYLSKQLVDNPIIFRIKIEDLSDIKFYIDPNHTSGIYTFDNINFDKLELM